MQVAITVCVIVIEKIIAQRLVCNVHILLDRNCNFVVAVVSIERALAFYIGDNTHSALGTCKRAHSIVIERYIASIAVHCRNVVSVIKTQAYCNPLNTFEEGLGLESIPFACHVLIGIRRITATIAWFQAILARVIGCVDKTYLPKRHSSTRIIDSTSPSMLGGRQHCTILCSFGKLEIPEVLIVGIPVLNLIFEILSNICIGFKHPHYPVNNLTGIAGCTYVMINLFAREPPCTMLGAE